MKKFMAMMLACMMLFGCAFAQEERTSELIGNSISYCLAFMQGNFGYVAGAFNDDLAAELDAAGLEQKWNEATSALGTPRNAVIEDTGSKDGVFVVEVEQDFANGELTIEFSYDGSNKLADVSFGAEEAAPEQPKHSWVEEECTVSAHPNYPLGATLCLPEGVENPPVVVLVQGSGASDRNETIFENKPFADIAHGLAEHGVASLRYDKRLYIYPELAGESGTDCDLRIEVLDDVKAAIDLIYRDSRLDESSVFVLGHSLGGMLMPAILSENADLAGGISMAGTLRDLWDIVYDQNMAVIEVAQEAGMGEAVANQLAQLENEIETLRGDISNLDDSAILLGVSGRYWKSLKEYSGMNFIADVQQPMLIAQGSADFQVYADVDYPLWEETLGERENVEFELYKGLNHLMMPTAGKKDVSEYQQAGAVSAEFIADVANFVKAN